MQNVIVVLDLQFGSTGKGQIAGTLGRRAGVDTAVCANMPNAGHTYRWHETYGVLGPQPTKIVHTVMPVGAVLPTVRNILIGPGAVIDIVKLQEEIKNSAPLLKDKRLIIHPNAGVVTEGHREAEAQLVRVGSTMKGSAEAVIEKMRRSIAASIARNYTLAGWEHSGKAAPGFEIIVDSTAYDDAVNSSKNLLVEGAQGASLSIHSSFYPYTTSRDVSLAQIWADCRLPAHSRSHDLQVIGVCRTYPIRVANRFDKDGAQIGTSGPCYPDQVELDWEHLKRAPELTTVTKLPRRLFSFSTLQVMESARFCGPNGIALTFCDYVDDAPKMAGAAVCEGVKSLIRRIEAATGVGVDYLSYGPMDSDVYVYAGDLREV